MLIMMIDKSEACVELLIHSILKFFVCNRLLK
jgi:hypothetical protein